MYSSKACFSGTQSFFSIYHWIDYEPIYHYSIDWKIRMQIEREAGRLSICYSWGYFRLICIFAPAKQLLFSTYNRYRQFLTLFTLSTSDLWYKKMVAGSSWTIKWFELFTTFTLAIRITEIKSFMPVSVSITKFDAHLLHVIRASLWVCSLPVIFKDKYDAHRLRKHVSNLILTETNQSLFSLLQQIKLRFFEFSPTLRLTEKNLYDSRRLLSSI